jgi:hypothetical protein
MPVVLRICGLYPGICLTTEEKHREISVRVVEKCPDIPVAVVQYTFKHKQYTETYLLAYLLTYLLTSWSRDILGKLTGFKLVKKLPAFLGNSKVHSLNCCNHQTVISIAVSSSERSYIKYARMPPPIF